MSLVVRSLRGQPGFSRWLQTHGHRDLVGPKTQTKLQEKVISMGACKGGIRDGKKIWGGYKIQIAYYICTKLLKCKFNKERMGICINAYIYIYRYCIKYCVPRILASCLALFSSMR